MARETVSLWLLRALSLAGLTWFMIHGLLMAWSPRHAEKFIRWYTRAGESASIFGKASDLSIRTLGAVSVLVGAFFFWKMIEKLF